MHLQQQSRKGGVRDTWWKGKHRNTLLNIKKSEDLKTSLVYLLAEQHTVLEICQGDLESVLVNAHADDYTATYITSTSLAMRIGRDTLHSVINLQNHLAGVNSKIGLDVCSAQVKYHVETIGLIRGKYHNRLQIICKVYIYLRDGQYKNWMSLKLQHAELTSLRTQINQQHDGAGHGYTCSHCKSNLHGGGHAACPWNE